MADDARKHEGQIMNEARRWADKQRADLAKSAWNFTERKDVKPTLERLDPTALRTMLSAASNASCLHEISILFRYQSGRDRSKWPADFMAAIEGEMQKIVDAAKKNGSPAPSSAGSVDEGEAMIVASWLGFVVRLHRYHYEAARETARETARGDRGMRR